MVRRWRICITLVHHCSCRRRGEKEMMQRSESAENVVLPSLRLLLKQAPVRFDLLVSFSFTFLLPSIVSSLDIHHQDDVRFSGPLR